YVAVECGDCPFPCVVFHLQINGGRDGHEELDFDRLSSPSMAEGDNEVDVPPRLAGGAIETLQVRAYIRGHVFSLKAQYFEEGCVHDVTRASFVDQDSVDVEVRHASPDQQWD
ncbi:hypothetical protein A2U01_0054645, partial [Trifolium medium]|nr:hypothetical protein [Trifolium medium]